MMNEQEEQGNDPLHGITLKAMLNELVACYGWEKLARWTKIRCFDHNPTINSSLKVLRKTAWARTKIENLYLVTKKNQEDKPKRGKRAQQGSVDPDPIE